MNLKKTIEHYLILQKQFEHVVLGGSAALILQKAIRERLIGDLDVVLPHYFEFQDSKLMGEANSTGADSFRIHNKDIGHFCLFVNQAATYETVEYEGSKIKVQSPGQIMSAKFKYYTKGIVKHKQDINDYLNGHTKKDTGKEDQLGIPF